ncbi:tyrosine-type recombinase/integrase [Nonomuraea sp. H19]|uniref:tyrosine-type recombinase/integrase n=1 Tax=Nonomuraea sp. H19 TaxID=3452206 RepID=UPI003F8B25E7
MVLVAVIRIEDRRHAPAGTLSRRLLGTYAHHCPPATLGLPKLVAQTLRQHHVGQAAQKLKAGEAWQDHNLVFCTSVGTQLDASNVRRAFRKITKEAGIGTAWSPRELRHSFVSIMSDQGVPIETIADLVGHAGTSVTEAVYRHQLRPVITKVPTR